MAVVAVGLDVQYAVGMIFTIALYGEQNAIAQHNHLAITYVSLPAFGPDSSLAIRLMVKLDGTL